MAEPRIILFDLEIIPDLQQALKVWPRLSQYPFKTLRASITSICCIGWKVLGQKKINCLNLWDEKSWSKDKNNDLPIIEKFMDIIKDADALVAHNGRSFDWKFFKTRMIKHNLYLPDIPQIDTKVAAQSNLFLFDNKLDTLGDFLMGERKMDHEGWDLWVKVHEGDKAAQKKMERYCKQDVKLLEQVYYPLRPYINNIPNHNLFYPEYAQGRKVCKNCGSTRLIGHGYKRTKTQTYKRYMCKDCGSVQRTDQKDRLPR